MMNSVRQYSEFQEFKTKQLETELNLLKSQLSPHFLFNTLNNLYGLTLKKADNAPEVIMKLSDLLRFTLETSKKNKVELRKEIDFIENYVELEKLRLSNRCDVKLNISGNSEGKMIAPMLLITFIENSFKHGGSSINKNSFIRIFLNIQNDLLKLTVENSRQEDQYQSSLKIGLENVRRKLELLYPGKHTLTIVDRKEIFKINLEIVL